MSWRHSVANIRPSASPIAGLSGQATSSWPFGVVFAPLYYLWLVYRCAKGAFLLNDFKPVGSGQISSPPLETRTRLQ